MNKRIDLPLLISYSLVLIPILDPYVFISFPGFTILIIDIMAISLFALVFIAQKGKIFNDLAKNSSLLIITIVMSIVTWISFIFPESNRDFMLSNKVLVVFLFYSVIFSILWSKNDFFIFSKFAYHVGLISSIFLVLQYMMVRFGVLSFYNGQIPFLTLSKYNAWAPLIDPSTGAIRVHSFFEEPSYFALFILPILSYSLQNKKFASTVIFLTALVLSASLLGFVIAIFIIIYHFAALIFSKGIAQKSIVYTILASLLMATLILFLYNFSPGFEENVKYLVGRLIRIGSELDGQRMTSANQRIIGNLILFKDYQLDKMIFGMGASQYALRFDVVPYSNNYVTFLLDYGMIGLAFFLFFLLKAFFRKGKINKSYILIFMIVSLTDYVWMNGYFFYLLSWILTSKKYANAIN